CVSTRRFNGGLDSFESSPYQTLSRGAFSASSLVTPIRADTSRDRVVPVCNTDLSLPTPPHTALVDRGRTASQTGPWPWQARLRAQEAQADKLPRCAGQTGWREVPCNRSANHREPNCTRRSRPMHEPWEAFDK